MQLFATLLVLVVFAAGVHIVLSGERTARRGGRLLLVWLLVGYCGLPMLVVSASMLLAPERTAATFGFSAGGAVAAFLGWAYLAMSVLAVMTLRYRGSFVIGAAVCWAVFFAGATAIHIGEIGRTGGMSHGGLLGILFTHGFVSALLLGGLLASGLLREPA